MKQTRFRMWRTCSQRGQSLLEVAFLTPILLALLIGAIELGRYAYIAIEVGNAARAGAAYGGEGLTQSADTVNIQCAAYNDYYGATNCTNPAGLSVTVADSCACDTGGTLSNQTSLCDTASNPGVDTSIATCATGGGHWVVMVAVTASGTYDSLFKYPGIPTPLTITRTATMRVAQN